MLEDLAHISPLAIVCITGLLVLMAGVFTPHEQPKGWLGYITVVGLAAALVAIYSIWDSAPVDFNTEAFAFALNVDHFGLGLSAVIIIGAILTTLSAIHYLPAHDADHAEYYSLVCFATLGMMSLVMAADLLTLFVALEVMSIAIYVLAGFKRQSPYSTESAMKYFILGSFASGLLLLGIAFTYGATGEVSMEGIAAAYQNIDWSATGDGRLVDNGIASLGMVFLVVAFGFKVAAAPFHAWTPDVYEGAPSPVTGLMAVAVKAAAFGALARLLFTCFGDLAFREGAVPWETIIAVLAVVSMFVGNLLALWQKSLKRMLAYSAIAHTGYILIALLTVPPGEGGLEMNALGGGLVFYLLAYTLANAAAFGVASAVSTRGVEDVSEPAYAGLAKNHPGLALVLAISMLSLLGIPVTAGFIGKLTIFGEALATPNSDWMWLIIVAVVNSVISAWYYLRVLVVAYMKPAADDMEVIDSKPLRWSTGLAALMTVFLGLLPSSTLETSYQAGNSLAQTTKPNVRLVTEDEEAAKAEDPTAPRTAATSQGH